MIQCLPCSLHTPRLFSSSLCGCFSSIDLSFPSLLTPRKLLNEQIVMFFVLCLTDGSTGQAAAWLTCLSCQIYSCSQAGLLPDCPLNNRNSLFLPQSSLTHFPLWFAALRWPGSSLTSIQKSTALLPFRKTVN